MPNFSNEWLNEQLRKPSVAARNPGLAKLSGVQKREDANEARTNNRPGKARMDETRNPRFKVSVTFRFSDNRKRDLDGALSTVLDCLIAAGRQQAADSYDLCH